MDVEIDSKLFVSCRLCLQEVGFGFQIIPTVQSQIKYCYDIDVLPFDGLPQLICKKCKTTLTDFFSTKENYILKQNDLKAKMAPKKKNIETQPDLVSSSQSIDEPPQPKGKKRKNRISSSDEETSSIDSNAQTELLNKKEKINGKDKQVRSNRTVLQNDLEKHYICRFCNRKCTLRKEMSTHLKCHHKALSKYASIYRKYCTVRLNKIDDSNQSSKAVIFDSKNIIENINNPYYFVKYEAKIRTVEDSISDDGEVISKLRKRKRILSSSSYDTVVIENDKEPSRTVSESEDDKNETEIPDTVISIDDSSEDECESNIKKDYDYDVKEHKIETEDTVNILQEIVTKCQTKFSLPFRNDRQSHISEDDRNNHKKLQSKLKKIVLNIGRKAINKVGFNCKGLLTYLEYKSLEIIWLPRIHETEKQFILFMAKEKEAKEKSNFQKLSKILDKDEDIEPDQYTDQEEYPDENTIPKHFDKQENSTLSSIQDSDLNSNKLLNSNPVLNPKKLPKKITETKDNHKLSEFRKLMDDFNEANSNEHLSIPIIVSTKSLAPTLDCETNDSQVDTTTENDANKKGPESSSAIKSAPRIKVKPVSELMPQRVLNDINQQSNHAVHQNGNITTNMLSSTATANPTHDSSVIYYQVQNATTNPACTDNLDLNSSTVSARDCNRSLIGPGLRNQDSVVLDTAELPNTVTRSPFIYLQNLLSIHNIILINQNHLTTHFVSLIKFRLRFDQESKNKPIELCLSLLLNQNLFCICVNDINNVALDWSNLSASWQWEILKSFMGNVVPKILQNSQKLGPMVYENASLILRLLRSIKFRKSLHSDISDLNLPFRNSL